MSQFLNLSKKKNFLGEQNVYLADFIVLFAIIFAIENYRDNGKLNVNWATKKNCVNTRTFSYFIYSNPQLENKYGGAFGLSFLAKINIFISSKAQRRCFTVKELLEILPNFLVKIIVPINILDIFFYKN